MKIKEILLTSAISTAVTLAAVYIFEKFVKPELECEPEVPDEMQLALADIKPETKKKIFDKFKPMKDAVLKKKLMDELERRDISITIYLAKGEKR